MLARWNLPGRISFHLLLGSLVALALLAGLGACSQLARPATATAVPLVSLVLPSLTTTPTVAFTLTPTAVASHTPLPSFTPTATPWPNTPTLPAVHFPASAPVLAMAFSPDGRTLAIAAGPAVRVCELPNLAERGVLSLGSYANSLAFHPDGRMLVLAAKDGSLQFWDVSGRLLCRLEAHARGANSLAFSPDGRRLLSAGNDAIARLWDVSPLLDVGTCSLPEPALMVGAAYGIPAVAFSPDGALLALADGGVIRLRDSLTRRLAHNLEAGRSVFSLAFDAGGSLLASGEISNTVQLWNVGSGEGLSSLCMGGGPKDFVWSVAFSPDGRWLAAGSSQGRVAVWEVTSGRAVLLPAHTGAVTSVAFSPDGRWLATGGLDGVLRLLPVDF